ncbi:MAG: hypothetical protein L3J95_05695 [Thermoplasmata archaeon]|nr:hypothetical protein [Thermoplasmata archaeon]MCI4359891.1 hypothetical protein [Thermoplasmata archaeon]
MRAPNAATKEKPWAGAWRKSLVRAHAKGIVRLHREGRFRGWLGRRFGGDLSLGERIWRRCLHLFGALVLLYYLVPSGFFRVLPNPAVLLLALAVILLVELLRWKAGLELPTIRPFEVGRIASFAYFAVAVVAAVLFFPKPVAVAVVLGTALIDPLIGELRLIRSKPTAYPAAPLVAYALIAFLALRWVGNWTVLSAVLAAGLAALLAVGVERVRYRHLDDDLTMTLVPGIALTILLLVTPGAAVLGG